MCVMSMVMDDYTDRWTPKSWPLGPTTVPYDTGTQTFTIPQIPTQKEIDEFRKLLDRARRYDKEHNQPDCGLDEKKAVLKKLAETFGIDISFIDED